MKKIRLVIAALFAFSAVSAFADPLTVEFPSGDSTVVGSVGEIVMGEYGYFWSVSRGDGISETFAGTGLASIDELTLMFEITRNVLNSGASTFWDVFVNGVMVGSWSWSDSDGIGSVNETYNFAPIAGAGTYSIRMSVINQVPSGFGSIAIGHPGKATIAPVPEPGTLALFGISLLGLGLARRRRMS